MSDSSKELFVAISNINTVKSLTVSISSLIKSLVGVKESLQVKELKLVGPPMQLRVIVTAKLKSTVFHK